MKKVKDLTILESEEEINKVIGCDHKWNTVQVSTCVNPRGEFVVGYGCVPILVKRPEIRCGKCGYVKGSLPKRIKKPKK